MDIAARYVGGYDVRRLRKGQTSEQRYLTPIAARLQRGALEFLAEVGFRDEALLLPPALLRSLPPETWSHWGVGPLDFGTTEFPLQQLIELMRRSTLERLLSTATLARVQNAELVFGEDSDRFTMAELITRIGEAVWAELAADVPATGAEAVSRFRRDLQRYHLERLITMVLNPVPGTPRDATALARLELEALVKALEGAVAGNSIGPLTEAHLKEALKLAQRALAAEAEAPLP
jgi:hypothetical protein